jgi:pimeloyl-ACP methyl ester carboxylesterase
MNRLSVSSPITSVAVAASAAASVFTVFRKLLPDISLEALEASERALMKGVVAQVVERWIEFATAHGTWRIHSFHKYQPDNGSGKIVPDVVFIHGHSAGSAHAESLFDRLHCNLHIIDMPGWGRSPLPPFVAACTSSVEVVNYHVEMLKGWLDALGLTKIQLIGHSYGAMMATTLASKHPEIVDQLILVAPAAIAPVMPANTFVCVVLLCPASASVPTVCLRCADGGFTFAG